ncbi:hypothetical protein UA34_13195 [Photobacterium angustum]|nr:hypothetical protein UA34_13195 [Photobacterium angustum]
MLNQFNAPALAGLFYFPLRPFLLILKCIFPVALIKDGILKRELSPFFTGSTNNKITVYQKFETPHYLLEIIALVEFLQGDL